jgi:repressor LexA
MELFGERLKTMMDKYNKTPEDIAEITNLSKPTISRYLNGIMEAKTTTIKIIAQYFKINPNYLLGLTDDPNINTNISNAAISNTEVVRLPVLGKISAGKPILAVENIESYEFVSKDLLNANCEYFLLRVEGDSMNLRIQNGDKVLIQKQDIVENGDIAAIIVNGFDAVIKKFYRNENIITLVPMSSNPEHIPQTYDTNKVDIRVVGKAIYVASKL